MYLRDLMCVKIIIISSEHTINHYQDNNPVILIAIYYDPPQ